MFRMTNPVRDYAWGSTTAFSRLFGLPADGPQAELWMGAHPAAPSQVVIDGAPTGLDALCERRPELLDGHDGFPYLFKVLAADRPLSIQTHPTRERAQAGFAAEEAAGIPRDSPRRNYKDTHHKPELVVAVEDFSALCGFRPSPAAAGDVAALRSLLADASAGSTADVPMLAALEQLEHLLEAERLAEALELILRGERGAFARIAAAVVEMLDESGPDEPGLDPMAADTLRRAGSAFPDDPGLLVALLLNRVDLSPGQALYLPAGNLHAYLHGVAVEIMANSDNVLRGGLTSKHIDVDELLAVTDATVLPVPWCTPASVDEHRRRYTPNCEEFQLEHLILGAHRRETGEETPAVRIRPDGPSVLLCLRGEIHVEGEAESRTSLVLRAGESAFLAPDEGVAVSAEAESEAFLAAPGRAAQD
ncbi:mannose-6-phosphate isomerase, class I [Nesterenkonia sp. HG001]|uniref:mannose-6-phosphate isomerase, class I n=1 Tax=Nesterenkonia sp. HG001 TaxID=2983207 RepID=UPI002AC5A9E9|nr:mannose-6-phosphate isomerase, class I [Nesterenkonia sp. HG001]MDZ5076953.1 mannose-6-phosphate isomerase, class I [Nesterenkonia sp. HG001]